MFAELHDELRAVARDMLGKGPAEWGVIARAGWLGLEVPGDLDGADATFAEVAVILREFGRAASVSPYFSVAVLALGALNSLEPDSGRDQLLRDAVSGAVVPVFVLGAEGETSFRVERCVLSGTADFVLDAPRADRLLVPALDSDGSIVVADVSPRAAGLVIAEQPVVDATRGFGRVVADGVRAESVWRFRGDSVLQRLRDRAAVAVACDSLGLSEAMLDATVAYVGVREQFGRKIGSFQAVQHACADMLVQVTVARKLVEAAVLEPDAGVAVSMAKSYACSAAVDVVGKAMQLHGGIGYTWESGIHAYLKRALLNRSLFGSPAAHRKRLARRYSHAQSPGG